MKMKEGVTSSSYYVGLIFLKLSGTKHTHAYQLCTPFFLRHCTCALFMCIDCIQRSEKETMGTEGKTASSTAVQAKCKGPVDGLRITKVNSHCQRELSMLCCSGDWTLPVKVSPLREIQTSHSHLHQT